MNIIVEPYKGVGPLRFGMNQEEVVSTFGTPEQKTQNHVGNTVLWYQELNATFENGALVEVGLRPNKEVLVLGVRPFYDPEGFSRLCELDGMAQEVLGFIVLEKLGIAMTGFHDGNVDQRAITAFAFRRWDAFKPKMKAFFSER